jgi:hypothetical protein
MCRGSVENFGGLSPLGCGLGLIVSDFFMLSPQEEDCVNRSLSATRDKPQPIHALLCDAYYRFEWRDANLQKEERKADSMFALLE